MSIYPFSITANFKFVSCDSDEYTTRLNYKNMSDTILTFKENFDKEQYIPNKGDFIRVVSDKNNKGCISLDVLTETTDHLKKCEFPNNEWIPLILIPYMRGPIMITGPAIVEYGVISDLDDRYSFAELKLMFSLNNGTIIGGNGFLGTLEYYSNNNWTKSQRVDL